MGTDPQRPPEFDARVMLWIGLLRKKANAMTLPNGYEPDDIVQETIAISLKRWRGYKSGESLPGWLVFQMRETVYSLMRSRKRAHENAQHEEIPMHISVPAQQEGAVEARIALGELTDSRGDRALVRSATGEMLKEIAIEMGITKQRVHQLVNESRERLRAATHYGQFDA